MTDRFSHLLGDERGVPRVPELTALARTRALPAAMPAPPASTADESAKSTWAGEVQALAVGYALDVEMRSEDGSAWLVFESQTTSAFALVTWEQHPEDDVGYGWAVWMCAGWAARTPE